MSDFKHQIRFRLSAPDPAGGAYSAPPDSLAGLRGPTSKGRGAGWEEGREGVGREGKGEGDRGRGRGGDGGRGGEGKVFGPTGPSSKNPLKYALGCSTVIYRPYACNGLFFQFNDACCVML